MSRVTTTARTVLQDLVERRLWPVAVLLLAAVLAVPVLMGGGEEPAPAPTAPAGASGSVAKAAVATDEGAQVTIVESTPPRRKRAGQARNPFVQPAAASSAASDASAGQTASAPSAAASSAPATGSSIATTTTTISRGADTGATGAGGAGSQPTSSVTTTPATRQVAQNDPSNDVFHVDLRFGSGPGDMKAIKDVARLTPLPSPEDPLFVFLGVMKDARTVVLLLPPGARGEGEGTCRPKATECRLLEVRTDETEIVDVPGADGATRQFIVRVTGVKRSEAKTQARATAAHQRASKVGQALLRQAAAAAGADPFDAYRYRPALGTLARAARATRAAGTGASTTSRPGEVVVWRTRAASKG